MTWWITKPRLPKWTNGWRESFQGKHANSSGCSNIHPFTRPESARTTAKLITPDRFPVHRTGRGGQHTYHGPGQRVAYVMLNLKKRHQDVRAFVTALEAWLINSLWHYHVRGERREDRVGVWVQRPERGTTQEDKIAAIGIRLRRWVTFHGISFNVDPELEHFSGIVPCGVTEHGVTSLVDLGDSGEHGGKRHGHASRI